MALSNSFQYLRWKGLRINSIEEEVAIFPENLLFAALGSFLIFYVLLGEEIHAAEILERPA